MSKADNKNHETMTQEEFMRKIGDLIAAGKQKKGVLEESEIRAEFNTMKLTDEQYELIVRVLEKNDIDVLQVVEEDDTDVPDDDIDMIDENGGPMTAHSLNPVPLIHIAEGAAPLADGGRLCDLSPTLLDMMGLPIPPEMTGKSLLVK